MMKRDLSNLTFFFTFKSSFFVYFRGDFEIKAMENMSRCKDFEYFLLKQEEHLENGGQMNFRFNVWQD